METIKYIAVHCTATPEGRHHTSKDIKSWHKAKGWSDIGYHFVVQINGNVEKGRSEKVPGAHVQGYNSNSIGVVYVGGCDKDMKPKDTRTTAQKVSLLNVLRQLKDKYPEAVILGHRDFPNVNKACPSFDAKTEYSML